jgi:hypothetical protein
MEESKVEKKTAPHSNAQLRKVVHGIVSEVIEHKEQERREAEARAGQSGHKRTVLLSLALCLAVAWIILSALVPRLTRVRVMPDELLGLWTTPAERYADRALEIKKASLVFHTGDGGLTAHPIQQVSKVERDSLVLYEIDYLVDDVVYTLSFYYEPAPVGTIRFENQQEMVWSR